MSSAQELQHSLTLPSLYRRQAGAFEVIQACWTICPSNICLSVTLYSCKKKNPNILSGKSNRTYDKKLLCYHVGEWDSRQVQT